MAQNFGVLQDAIPYYSRLKPVINPVFSEGLGTMEAFGGFQGFTGIRSSRNLSYGTFLLHGRKSDEEPVSRHSFGVSARGQRIGQYLSRNKLHGNYAVRVMLSSEMELSGGVGLGFFNMAIADNPSGVVGSETVLDGNIGVKLSWRDIFGAVLIDQAFNSVVQPALETYALERQFGFLGGAKLQLTSYLIWSPDLYVTKTAYSPTFWQLNNGFECWKVVELGFGITPYRIIGNFYVAKVPVGKREHVGVGLAYDVGYSDQTIGNSSAFQVFLNFKRE